MGKQVAIFLAGATVFCLVVLLVVAAKADEPAPYGLGHPPNHTEYFDGNCCNENDCEIIPNDAVKAVEGGWRVRYWTKNYGGLLVDDFVPFGTQHTTKRCDPQGNCNGACSIPGGYTTKCTNYGCEVDRTKPAKVRCLYTMPEA